MLCRRGQSVPSAALYSQRKLRRGLARLIPYGANPLVISGITQGNSLRQMLCRWGQSVPSAALYSQRKLRRGLARLIPYGANPLVISGITQGNSLRQMLCRWGQSSLSVGSGGFFTIFRIIFL